MMRYWAPKYRMEIVTLSHDTIECRVGDPPLTRAKAMALAREQCHYSCDIVAQGTETVVALAASLLSSDYWYFWWDWGKDESCSVVSFLKFSTRLDLVWVVFR